MKRTNRNKIVISSLLVTVLLGAAVVKTSQDAELLSTFAYVQKETRTNLLYDDGWYAQKAFSGNPDYLEQKTDEIKAVDSEWTEYKENQVGYDSDGPNGPASSSTPYKLGEPAYIAMNYSLVTSPEDVTIGPITTNQYYEIGGVFRLENYGSVTNKEYFNAFINNLATENLVTSSELASSYSDNAVSLVHQDNGEMTAQDVIEAGFSNYSTTSGFKLQERANYLQIYDFDGAVTEEEWHKSFTNDETTLFGATKYNPKAHFIIRIPIQTNPLDADPNDTYGLTPTVGNETVNGNYAAADAISNKDIMAISSVSLEASSSPTDGKPTYYMTLGPSAQYLGDASSTDNWDEIMDHAMELAYPKPEFTITPMGYNDRNQFEVDVVYDHKAVPKDYDIVTEIKYTMMGPATKESTAEDEKVLWDEITITDQSVTREYRANIDSPETTTKTIWTYGQPVPEELEQWIDNDKDNGGQYDIDGNYVDGGAEEIFGPEYTGDIEIGVDDVSHSVIKYDGLFYGDNVDDKGKEYDFSNTITIAPTQLGSDNAYLLEIGDGNFDTLTYGPWDYVIEPGSATPILEHFEVTKPESTDAVDPFGTLELKYSGDSKSYDEDTGVGLKPSYLNMLQVIAVETDELGNVIGEEIALTDPFKPTNLDDHTGAFSGQVTTKEGIVLNAQSHYRISLRGFYGNEALPEDPIADSATLVVEYTKPGEFINISTDNLGDLNINITNNVVAYDPAKPELGATLTFGYKQSIPEGFVGDASGFLNPEIAKVEIVNYLGEENEEVIEEVDASGITLTDTEQTATVNVASDKLLPNKTYDLSVRVTTVAGRTHTSEDANEDVDFTTPATGPFVPEIGMLAPINTVDTAGGLKTTDFEFVLKQQVGDGIDLVETSESNITNISLTINDGVNDIVSEDSIAIPSEDESTILITDSVNKYDSVTEYDYAITVTYGDSAETVVKEGKISFELNGYSELEERDVVMTDISSTMTSLYLETEINDVEIAPGYDSFFVNNVEIVDAENNPVDAIITWYDEEGNIIEAPKEHEEGVAFSGKFSAQLLNIAAGTDLSTYQIHINTNSLNESEDDPTPFETDYYFNIFELAELGGLTDATGNFLNSPDMSKEFMDVEPIEVSDFILNEELVTVDSATFQLSFNDKLDVITKENLVLKDNYGAEYSLAAGNMTVEHLNTRAAGIKTYEFTLAGLKENTEYTGFTVSYEISENLGTEEAPIVSSTSYTVETDASFTTLEAPKPESKFPWWIIILLLILTIVGILLLLAFLFLRNVRVVSTTETTKGSTTFVVNRDNQSGFLDTINGAKLEATQNGKTSTVEYKASVNADSKVAITLTGITNDAPIKGLKFIVDKSTVEASNAKVETANKSLEDKFAKETEAYQAAVKTWEENKAKANEAGKEFTDAKPEAPAKPALEKLAKPNKDVKVIGSVKTALEDSSNKEEPKKPATEEKPAAKKTTTATTAAKKPAVKKPTEAKAEEENKSATGSAEIIY